MPAQVGNVNRNSPLQQRLRHAMHVVAAPRRAVNQDGHLRVSPFIQAIGERSAISRFVARDRRKPRHVHFTERVGYRFEGLRLADMAQAHQHPGDREQCHEVDHCTDSNPPPDSFHIKTFTLVYAVYFLDAKYTLYTHERNHLAKDLRSSLETPRQVRGSCCRKYAAYRRESWYHPDGSLPAFSQSRSPAQSGNRDGVPAHRRLLQGLECPPRRNRSSRHERLSRLRARSSEPFPLHVLLAAGRCVGLSRRSQHRKLTIAEDAAGCGDRRNAAGQTSCRRHLRNVPDDLGPCPRTCRPLPQRTNPAVSPQVHPAVLRSMDRLLQGLG